MRESWEAREETLNSKLNEEAATNEAHAQVKQDLADTEAKVASDKNFLVTDEDDADAGGAAGGAVLFARGAGRTALGTHSSRGGTSRGMLEASKGWAAASTTPMTRGAGDTKRLPMSQAQDLERLEDIRSCSWRWSSDAE